MADPEDDPQGGPVPAFPAFGVSRAGEALSADMHPPRPQTPAPDPDKVAAMLADPGTAPVAEKPEAVRPNILLLDDDFFGAMDFADALADALDGDVRTAVSDQKAGAIIAEARPTLAVLSVSTHGASGVAAQLASMTIPFALLTGDGQGGPAAQAYPDAPVLNRSMGAADLQTALTSLAQA